jgi:dTMP kinase
MSTKRGIFIVVEGLDKAGKSTQCEILATNLTKDGHKVQHMRFPDRTTTTGKMIDSYLKGTDEMDDHAIHLLFSANRWEAASKIERLLLGGTSVVVDRYYFSGVVYSVAKRNPSLKAEWARAPDVGLPAPDVCFFLDISAEEAAKRGGGYGEERYEKKERQDAVREEFHRLLSTEDQGVIVKIDAGQSREAVESNLLDIARTELNIIGNQPILKVLDNRP